MDEIIVCASGYFNPAHIGHIRYLQAAKSLGTHLVVIVNNDLQVKLKGSIPFMNEDERLEIIQSLRCVDSAVLSIDKDRTVSKTLELVQPHIFANGGDVAFEDCREASVCDRLGIYMVFGVGGSEKLQSSSNLLKPLS